LWMLSVMRVYEPADSGAPGSTVSGKNGDPSSG
jgi:hypothetical protein